MQLFIRVSLLLIALTNARLFAAEILWLNITPHFTYRDVLMSCSSDLIPRDLYLALQLSDSKIDRAILHTSTVFGGGFDLKADEIEGIELSRESDQVWLKTLSLGPDTLKWLFFRAGGAVCHPPQSIKVIEPSSHIYRFDLNSSDISKKGVSDLLVLSGFWEGKESRQYPYTASLWFKQEIYP